jgi:SAM-dependent methyltransferase/predicted RNA-binding Zn-ribbon protein involved in translation (DUF1610 family)
MASLDDLVNESPSSRVDLGCPGCRATITVPAERMRVNGYTVYRCPACGSLTTSPLPSREVLVAHYARFNEQYSAGMGRERYRREMPRRWAARLDVIDRFGGKGRLLDVAGSNGMFGALASSQGFRVDVVDFIPAPVDLGFAIAQPANLDVAESIPFADATFDVVTLWSCIEHVRDPETSLREAARVLRPGGLFAIDTPLVGDLCERLFAARSHWVCPPEHLHLFSARGLVMAMQRAGLDVALAAPFFERTRLRWLARRGRNVALAGYGAALRLGLPAAWARGRASKETSAGDIQFIVCRKASAAG